MENYNNNNSAAICVRPFKVSDADDLLSWGSDDRVTRFLRWNSITSKQEAINYINNVAMTHPWRRSICLHDRSIGYVSVRPESGDYRCKAHVSYAVAAQHWGKGIATAALRMAIPEALKEFPEVVRVEALVEVDNEASQRVLHKLGFHKEEDCTQYYINQVKAKFDGKWLCGLCSEAVRDEVNRGKKLSPSGMEEAVKAHMSFCGKIKSNPAVRVADGMRQMLRRRSIDLPGARSSSTSQVAGSSGLPLH
ncbi:hypothetical protein PIB30_023075 [Stylosanthes scabra]|uniref:N-acetyltransferase domain-containing protein n=1 Tax=Stylosanthes scabra TaxID=79078 RepID=A0ABU6XB10_9FABA|nr:hypothetical protein [Stylosanthes scabra]